MSRLGRSLVVWTGVALAAASAAADEAPKTAPEPSEVRVQNVEVRLSQAGPVVLLRVGNKAIPVFVDALVAESIQGALVGKKPPRPLSHDLMHTILQALDAKVSQVIITQKDGIFYGALTLVAGNTTRVFDSRSSDAIALAIRFKAPILLSPKLVDSFGVELAKPGVKEL
jgi:bifunctional DNase/RNase